MVLFLRYRHFFLPVLLILSSLTGLYSQDIVLPVAAQFTSMLGLIPEDAIEALGAPESVFSYRGETEDDDNVVFYYEDNSYIFWFRDRVWQTRVDHRWKGDIDGVSMGMTLEEIEVIWGMPPINYNDDGLTWTVPDQGYPVRIRLFFDEDGYLHDVYVFRSDW